MPTLPKLPGVPSDRSSSLGWKPESYAGSLGSLKLGSVQPNSAAALAAGIRINLCLKSISQSTGTRAHAALSAVCSLDALPSAQDTSLRRLISKSRIFFAS